MPYELKGDCVHKVGESKPMKCYPGEHDKAVRYMRALEANMPANEKELDINAVKSMMLLSQAETNYGAANGTVGKACSTCRWFCPADDGMETMCHLVMDDPAPITPNGLCDRWEAVPMAEMNAPEPIPVEIVDEGDDIPRGAQGGMALPTTMRGLIDTIKDVLKALTQPPPAEEAFSVFKAQDGKHYWLARHTGKFIDREGEIITDKAHSDYVARVQKGLVPLPELWVWHKKGTRHGQADLVWKSGGFVLALGHFDDTPAGQKAIAYYQKNSKHIKLSHMFNFPRRAKENGVYHAYNTVEITVLPDGAEAFPYTSFEEIKSMALTKEQEKMILDIGGDDMLKRVQATDTKALTDTPKLEALGVESKGLDNFDGSDILTDKELEALKSDMDTRLKAVETLPDMIEVLQTVVKTLNKELGESRGRESDTMKRVNDLEKKLLEYQAVEPPGSQSKDTLLNEREQSVIQKAMNDAKAQSNQSVIGMALGTNSPAVPQQ